MKELDWWEDSQNKTTFDFPISVIKEGERYVASTNEDTDKYLGKFIGGVSQGSSKEEAIENLFSIIKFCIEHYKEESLRYQRWVPFRKGDWSHAGGKWFVIFGLQFYFRVGKNMKHGWCIPFTKLNVFVSNEWKEYRRFKKEQDEK